MKLTINDYCFVISMKILQSLKTINNDNVSHFKVEAIISLKPYVHMCAFKCSNLLVRLYMRLCCKKKWQHIYNICYHEIIKLENLYDFCAFIAVFRLEPMNY